MQTRSMAWFLLILAVLLPGTAIAQERGQIGVSFGYPTTVGIAWHIADRLAIRPEVSFEQSSFDTEFITTVSAASPFEDLSYTERTHVKTDSTTVGVGVSGLIYVWKKESLSAFVSPRYAYAHGTITTSGSATTFQANDGRSRSHSFSGSFGAQYALGRRFSVFGEIGLGYTRENASTSAPQSDAVVPVASVVSAYESKGHRLGTRSGVGVTLYFR